MKRVNNLYQKICKIDNLRIADKLARKGKGLRSENVDFDKNYESNLISLHTTLINKTYHVSGYSTFKIYEPKERIIYRLKSYRDRIVQHAIMNVLQPVFTGIFTTDTYSCIKGRGIHSAARKLRSTLKNIEETAYCLKLDIRKYYPSIDHAVLKTLLRRKFKDKDLLWLFDEIINSAEGLPIGNYLSQYLANYYLTGFDHWIKETKKVKHYFRYADDLVILSNSKTHLHKLLFEIKEYLQDHLSLTVKKNYQLFPIANRGIDFIGYVFSHDNVRLRKSIKKNFCRMIKLRRNPASIASYNGWIKYCRGRHLFKTYLQQPV